jgi:hypothetical protein
MPILTRVETEPEYRHFMREIAAVQQKKNDHGATVKLICGHESYWTSPPKGKEAYCAQCLGEFLEARRKSEGEPFAGS